MSVADCRKRRTAKVRALREERKRARLCIECAAPLPLEARYVACDLCRAGNRAVWAAKKERQVAK